MKRYLVGLFFLSQSLFAQSNLQLISWFAGADIVGTTGNSDAELESDFYVREFEFSAYSTIDQTFDGILTMAYHKELEASEEHLEVHEAFLFSSKLVELSNVKIGKFFLGFGRLNRFHRHDWAFTDAPVVQKSFFGNEGAKDTGIEYKRNLVDLYSTITIGITSGKEFNHNHSHEEEEEEAHHEGGKAPTGYMRFAKFFEFSTTEGIELGVNYIHRVNEEAEEVHYYGLDGIYKDRVGKFLNHLVQFEAWGRSTEGDEDYKDYGAYLYYEHGLDQHHALGARLDYYEQDHRDELSEAVEEHDHQIDGLDIHHSYSAASLSYIYTNSEFMKTRFTVEHGKGIHTENDKDNFTRGFVQIVFSIGAHPAHVY